MKDYIIWVMESNERYILVQFLNNEIYEERIWEVQKEFVNKGYEISEMRRLPLSGMTTIEFYKVDNNKDYVIINAHELEKTQYEDKRG